MPSPDEDTRRVAFKINFQEYKIKSLDFGKRKVAAECGVFRRQWGEVANLHLSHVQGEDTPNKTASLGGTGRRVTVRI